MDAARGRIMDAFMLAEYLLRGKQAGGHRTTERGIHFYYTLGL
jgi:hypothetical protein